MVSKNYKKLKVDMTFSNYPALCRFLEEEVKKGGKSKALQIKEWSKYFLFKTVGREIIITHLLPNITREELLEEFIIDEELKKCKDWGEEEEKEFKRQLRTKINFIERNGKIIIKEFYSNPFRPSNFQSMQRGMSLHLIPLLLQEIIKSNSDVIAFNNKTWALKVGLITNNMYLMMRNTEVFSDSLNPYQIEVSCLNDMSTRLKKSVNRYINNNIDKLQQAGLIKYIEIPYLYLKKDSKVEISEGGINIITDKGDKKYRASTTEERALLMQIHNLAKDAAGIPRAMHEQECYYGEKADVYRSEYRTLLDEYNSTQEYKIMYAENVLEVHVMDKIACQEVMNLFDVGEARKQIGTQFKKSISNSLYQRIQKNSEKYNTTYREECEKMINYSYQKESLNNNEAVKKLLRAKSNEKKIKVNYIET